MVRPLALTTLPPPGAGRTPVARARKAVDEFEAAGGVEELNLRLLASTTRLPHRTILERLTAQAVGISASVRVGVWRFRSEERRGRG